MLVCLIQARSTSTRFPGKCFAPIYDGKNSLELIYGTARNIVPLTFFIIPSDDAALATHLQERSLPYFSGPYEPLARYMQAATALRASYIVRLTADCPLLDSAELHYMCTLTQSGADFISNAHPVNRHSIDGNDIEVMSYKCLTWLNTYAKGDAREHVTQHIYTCDPKYVEREKLSTIYYRPLINYNKLIKTSIDVPEDLDRLTKACI